MLIHWLSLVCESISEHPINGRKCRAYWISRNGIKHLKARNDKYFKAKDLYFELLDMELGKKSYDTFDPAHIDTLGQHSVQCTENMASIVCDPVQGTLAIAIIPDVQKESLAGRPIEDDLRNENGQIVVSSRMVAERFGKRHADVIRAIEEKISENAKLRSHKYFLENSYKVEGNNKSYKEYLMTRDGFTLLAMGFTGKEAMKFQLAYIEAFNKMEEALKNQSPALPATYKEALIALVAEIEVREKLEIEVKAKEEAIQEMKPKSEYCEKVLEAKGTVTTTFIAKDYGMSGILKL